ncbi:MAG: hypothetical protein KBD78_11285 [Oligoflexales bacterium]|nr:hypothetical protein [Oligoflexales bacterium]
MKTKQSSQDLNKYPHSFNNEAPTTTEQGSVILITVILLGVLAVTISFFSNQTKQKSDLINNLKSGENFHGDIRSSINRIIALTRTPSAKCGQYKEDPAIRTCPALYPEPYYCKTGIKLLPSGDLPKSDWSFDDNKGNSDYFFNNSDKSIAGIYSDPIITESMTKYLSFSGEDILNTKPLPRMPGVLGTFSFKYPAMFAVNSKQTKAMFAYDIKTLATGNIAGSPYDKSYELNAVAEGFDCDKDKIPIGVFTRFDVLDSSQDFSRSISVKIPLAIPKASCELAVDKFTALPYKVSDPDIDGSRSLVAREKVTFTLIANGLWEEAQFRSHTVKNPKSNWNTLSLKTTKVVLSEQITPSAKIKSGCSNVINVSAKVTGIGGDVSSCNSLVYLDISKDELAELCDKPNYRLRPGTEKGPGGTITTSNGSGCPNSFNIGGGSGKKLYYKYTSSGCVGVYGDN